ncbi:MAG TPA: ATP-binding cassette domain-containing protein [Solirubrobacteraceae bacterium]|nr:ATP-binding cassette domain-containing protein [Solirubrobacteraceae bacterium]
MDASRSTTACSCSTNRLPACRSPRSSWLLGALRSFAEQGQTILYVSHRLEEVFALAHSATVLRDGRVVASRELAGLDEQQLVRMIVGRALSETAPVPSGPRTGTPVLELRGVSAGPVHDISLEVRGGEVLGIAGLVGSGRTSLLEAIYGAVPIRAGTMLLDGVEVAHHSITSAIKAGLSYVPEDRAAQGAFLSLGVSENLSAADPGRYVRRLLFRHRAERDSASRVVAKFGIRTPAVTAPLAMLSGGNQQKTIVARWLQRTPKVLLLDEPTQGLSGDPPK